MNTIARFACLALFAASASVPVLAQATASESDIPAKFEAPTENFDYVKRVEMVPMRDGVKLYTVIVIPKGAKNVPMVLTRTCYNAAARAQRAYSPKMSDTLPLSDDVFVGAGWIRVYQDVRGKYGSEGNYLMTPPPIGPLNSSGVDDTTDAYDTIDWLVKNVSETNGRVAMIGSSYEGFTVVMALIHPHPALKVAAPESPMVDGWMGDDWFHYGAFRQPSLDYVIEQETKRGQGTTIPRDDLDDYTFFLKGGSAGDIARAAGLEQFGFWKKLDAHPAYDAFWQGQALDKIMASTPLAVPVLWEQGLWDQEDMWGAIHCYEAVEPKDTNNDKNFLVMGPWAHSQVNRDGWALGPLLWNGNTTLQYRRDMILPFFREYLVDGAPKADISPVTIYNTGENHWDKFKSWPLACEHGCAAKSKALYLTANHGLTFDAPASSGAGAGDAGKYDEYISDPAKPVPYRPRPVNPADGDGWRTWLVTDQRFVDGRQDVLTYVTEPLTTAVRVSGVPEVHLFASTSGTDSDWVVKLIDVYPGTYPSQAALGGYELPVSLDIFRGRYRTSFEKPEALLANQPQLFKFGLPTVNHIFQPGHRIMVQVQSTLFPLYDRNPQTYVPNIFDAQSADFQKATQRIWRSGDTESYVDLPVVP
ncbi:MAG: CocE/NonD family hydrolase [Candidatus Acidiferrales bacterium]